MLMTFVLEVTLLTGALMQKNYLRLVKYLEALQSRPACLAAIER